MCKNKILAMSVSQQQNDIFTDIIFITNEIISDYSLSLDY